MPILLRCPDCTASLTFADNQAGRRFPCPMCSVMVHVPGEVVEDAERNQFAELPPSPMGVETAEHISERPATPAVGRPSLEEVEIGFDPSSEVPDLRRQDIVVVQDPQAWRIVWLGLDLFHNAFMAMFLLVMTGFGFSLCLVATDALADRFLPIARYAFLSGVALCVLTACAGQLLCCAAPQESEAKGYAQGAALFLLLGMIAAVSIFLLLLLRDDFQADFRHTKLILVLLALPLFGAFVTSHALYILFLKQVCQFFHSRSVAQNAFEYLCAYVLYASAVFFSVVLPAALLSNADDLIACSVFALFFIGLPLVVWFLRLVKLTSHAIEFWVR